MTSRPSYFRKRSFPSTQPCRWSAAKESGVWSLPVGNTSLWLFPALSLSTLPPSLPPRLTSGPIFRFFYRNIIVGTFWEEFSIDLFEKRRAVTYSECRRVLIHSQPPPLFTPFFLSFFFSLFLFLPFFSL